MKKYISLFEDAVVTDMKKYSIYAELHENKFGITDEALFLKL